MSVIIALVRSTIFVCANSVLSQVVPERRGNGKLFGVRETTPPALSEVWKFRPFRFKQFKAPADVDDEIHFAGSVAPKEEATSSARAPFAVPELGENKCFPYCSHGRRLPERLNRSNIQQRAKQA